MSAPVDIYLDVDGVINAVCLDTPEWGWGEMSRVTVNGYTISYSPNLVAALNALAALPNVSMHWLTTWEHDAPDLLSAAIGLDGRAWPVLGTAQHYSKELGANYWWKLAALRDYHPPRERSGIWLDDDIRFDRDARLWIAETPTITAFSPDTGTGLTVADLDAIALITQGQEVPA